MFLIARLRALDLRAEMERESLYAAHLTARERLSWQLAQFNRVWKDVTRQHVPFYRRLVDRYSLPREFANWQQFSDSFPPIDKNAVREQGSALNSGVQRPDFYRMTGGSPGDPCPTSLLEYRVAVYESGPLDTASLVWNSCRR